MLVTPFNGNAEDIKKEDLVGIWRSTYSPNPNMPEARMVLDITDDNVTVAVVLGLLGGEDKDKPMFLGTRTYWKDNKLIDKDLSIKRNKKQIVIDGETLDAVNEAESLAIRNTLTLAAKDYVKVMAPMAYPYAKGHNKGREGQEVISKFIDSVKINNIYRDGKEVAHISYEAARDRNVALMRLILKAGHDVTMLHEGESPFVRLFSSSGWNPNRASRERYAILKDMIKHGFDVNTPINETVEMKEIGHLWAKNELPIFIAAKANDIGAIKIMVEAGANINALDSQGRNIAFYLTHAYRGHKDDINYLADAKLDFSVIDKNGETALQHWKNREDEDPILVGNIVSVIEQLQEKGSYDYDCVSNCVEPICNLVAFSDPLFSNPKECEQSSEAIGNCNKLESFAEKITQKDSNEKARFLTDFFPKYNSDLIVDVGDTPENERKQCEHAIFNSGGIYAVKGDKFVFLRRAKKEESEEEIAKENICLEVMCDDISDAIIHQLSSEGEYIKGALKRDTHKACLSSWHSLLICRGVPITELPPIKEDEDGFFLTLAKEIPLEEQAYNENWELYPLAFASASYRNLSVAVEIGKDFLFGFGKASVSKGVKSYFKKSHKNGHKLFHAVNLDELPFDPRYTAGSAKAWTSIKGRLKALKLPIQGKIRFIPPKDYNPKSPLTRGKRDGFLDRFGNEWVKGSSRTKGENFEWDVQLSAKGKAMLGHLSRDKSHINISLKGRVTHK